MSIGELNTNGEICYIDSNDINLIKEYGQVGLYMSLAKKKGEDIYANGEIKDTESATDAEICEFIKRNFDRFQQRYGMLKINISSKNINEEIRNIIENEFSSIPIIVDFIGVNNNLDELTSLMNLPNVFLKDTRINKTINSDELFFLISVTNHNKKIKYDYNNVSSKNEFTLDKLNNYDSILIQDTSNIKKINEELKSIIKYINSIDNKTEININITDERFLNNLPGILELIEEEIDIPHDKMLFKFNLDSIAGKIKTGRRYKMLGHIPVSCNGIEFNNLGEFSYFNDFSNLILSKIPSNASEIEKVVYISEFLINYFKYDYDNYEKAINGTGTTPLKNFVTLASTGIGVCRDYAKLTEYFLNKVGIRCNYIASNSYAYMQDKDIPGKVKFNSFGEFTDPKYDAHAFNIVYIDDIPYYLDNTWIDKEDELYNSPQFLVSTDVFNESHSEYVEVLKNNCPRNYDRHEIFKALNNINTVWSEFNEEDVNFLYSIGQSTLAGKVLNDFNGRNRK